MSCVCEVSCLVYVRFHVLCTWGFMSCVCEVSCLVKERFHVLCTWGFMSCVREVSYLVYVNFHVLYTWSFMSCVCEVSCLVYVRFRVLCTWGFMSCLSEVSDEGLCYVVLIKIILCVIHTSLPAVKFADRRWGKHLRIVVFERHVCGSRDRSTYRTENLMCGWPCIVI